MGEAKRWRGEPYLAEPDPEAPGYYSYLTCIEGHKYHVTESELEDIHCLVADTAWYLSWRTNISASLKTSDDKVPILFPVREIWQETQRLLVNDMLPAVDSVSLTV
jgi:hypothetical protein